MSAKKRIVVLVLFASLILSACGAQTGTEVPTLDVNAIMTAGGRFWILFGISTSENYSGSIL